MKNAALITGITGQDGAYLARFLLDKGYEVTGFTPRRGSDTLWRLRELQVLDRIDLAYGDVTDMASVSLVVMVDELRRPVPGPCYGTALRG